MDIGQPSLPQRKHQHYKQGYGMETSHDKWSNEFEEHGFKIFHMIVCFVSHIGAIA